MPEFTSLPGVFDILPDAKDPWKTSVYWQNVESILREIARLFGFEEIRTPILERTELFKRTVGETSDIVSKEMYTFIDRGDRSVTLRPEGTAPVVRALLENGFLREGKLSKVFYIEPMFRYERSQAGRYRQHHQFGAEFFGSPHPEADVETISLLVSAYRKLGLKKFHVALNTLGSEASRSAYKEALRGYLEGYKDQLSEDSKIRFETNLLRILDSKDKGDREILTAAPKLSDFLDADSSKHFERVRFLLGTLDIETHVEEKLVRGLDYYTGTVFEIVSTSLGAQNSIGGGGRYDRLVKDLGGPSIPAVGFGTGLERIIQAALSENVLEVPSMKDVLILPLSEAAYASSLQIAHHLRASGIGSDIRFGVKKLQKALRDASLEKVRFTVIVGEDELARNVVQLKNMETHGSLELTQDTLIKAIKEGMTKSCSIS